jgi:lipopolysaccharide export LptBFGC system permease protein LptF
VVREFLNMFFLVLSALCAHAGLHLLRPGRRHPAQPHPLATVGDYLINLTPSMLYQIAPLAVLIAVLVTFGVLNRNSESSP